MGLAPSELTESDIRMTQHEKFDAEIKRLKEAGMTYSAIARELNTTVDIVKNALYMNSRVSKSKPGRGGRPGRKQVDWKQMDWETLPKVQTSIEKIKASDKPQQITVGWIARSMGLLSKQIDKLPLCRAEILKQCQSLEAFWAEKVL